MTAYVYVSLKKSVLDPQGKTIHGALKKMGYKGLEGVRQGKYFELTLDGLSRDEAESKFGFLLEAFNYGPPPHGGIAFGLDRLAATLTGTDAIREVMAFPKASSGGDPLTGAPTPITAQQRKDAGIDVTPGGTAPPPNRPGGETIPDERRN